MFELFQQKPKNVSKDVKSAIAGDMTLDQVLAAMFQLLAEEHINHYRMGEYYNYVMDRKLAELAGFKDAPDYFRQKFCDVSTSALSMYGSVAHNFSEEITRRYGMTCLYLLLSYKKAAGIQVDHQQPGATLIDVPDSKGVVTSKPFSACSVDEMRRACQGKRQPAASKPLTAADVALADQIGGAVTSRFVKGDPVRVQLRNHEGTPVMDFKGIPLAKVEQLKEALVAHSTASQALQVKPPTTS